MKHQLAFYQVYCAAVVLYTYTFKLTSSNVATTWIKYFRAAESCQSYITSTATADMLPHRFHIIMDEYRREVMRQIKDCHPSIRALAIEACADTSVLSEDLQPTMEGLGDTDINTLDWFQHAAHEFPVEQDMTQYTGWEQLHPFVSFLPSLPHLPLLQLVTNVMVL